MDAPGCHGLISYPRVKNISVLDKSKKTLVYCYDGYRSYLAERILKQKAFDVIYRDGGYKSITDSGFKALEEVPYRSC